MARFGWASLLVLAFLGTFHLASVSGQGSILVELLGSKYDGLVNLLEHADLLGTLESEVEAAQGQGKGVTIFAPTDYHLMHRVSPALLSFLKQDRNVDLLRKVLLHHVIVGKIDAASWYPTQIVTTLAGSEAQLFLDGGELRVDGAAVRELKVLEAEDGVVHAINGFLIPKAVHDAVASAVAETEQVVAAETARRFALQTTSVASSPAASPTSSPTPTASPTTAPAPAPLESDILLNALAAAGVYSTLIQLLKESDLLTELNTLVAEGHPVTLFAPTDAAFAALGPTLLNELLTGPKAIIDEVLLYHVIVGGYTYDQLLAIGMGLSATPTETIKAAASTGVVQTAANIPLTVTTVNNTVYLGTYPPGVALDSPTVVNSGALQVHGLNGVLIPPGLFPPTPAPSGSSPPSPVGSGSSPPGPPPPSSAGYALCVDGRLLLLIASAVVGTLVL